MDRLSENSAELLHSELRGMDASSLSTKRFAQDNSGYGDMRNRTRTQHAASCSIAYGVRSCRCRESRSHGLLQSVGDEHKLAHVLSPSRSPSGRFPYRAASLTVQSLRCNPVAYCRAWSGCVLSRSPHTSTWCPPGAEPVHPYHFVLRPENEVDDRQVAVLQQRPKMSHHGFVSAERQCPDLVSGLGRDRRQRLLHQPARIRLTSAKILTDGPQAKPGQSKLQRLVSAPTMRPSACRGAGWSPRPLGCHPLRD